MKKEKYYIGIDPDVLKVGFALYKQGSPTFDSLEALSLIEIAQRFNKMKAARARGLKEEIELEIVVRVENPEAANATHRAAKIYAGTKGAAGHFGALGAACKAAYSLGRCAEVALIIESFALFHDFTVERISPQQRQTGDKLGEALAADIYVDLCEKMQANKKPIFLSKVKAALFGELTHWKGRTNDEKRDAGLLLLPEILNAKHNLY